MAAVDASTLGQALVGFSLNHLFPDENVSSLTLSPDKLPAAIQTLADAKSRLENDIHTIVQETADDVQAWMANAKALQVDLARRKTLASDILVRADAPAASGHAIEQAEARARFLTQELNYNLQVRYLLESIRNINQLLDEAERAAGERRILDALRLLEKSWTALDAMPVSKSCRAMRLLDLRAFELKSDVHRVLDHVWGALVHVDPENGTLSVFETLPDEPMSLSDAVVGLKAYKEVDSRMTRLWHDLDRAVVAPRTNLSGPRPRIFADDSRLGIRESDDNDNDDDNDTDDGHIHALFADLDRVFTFLATKLPADLVQSISSVMMPELVARITDVWLASAVPTSLDGMARFEEAIRAAGVFQARLEQLQYGGHGQLQEWVENAPRVWLSKRRERMLDAVRSQIAEGLGTSHEVERVEKHMVSRAEGKELARGGGGQPIAAATEQAADWDTAWSDEGETEQDEEAGQAEQADDGADAWAAWGDEEETVEAEEEATQEATQEATKETTREVPLETANDDDAAEAWGWGDEDANEEEPQPAPEAASSKAPPSKATKAPPEETTRELVLRETFHISSMPAPLLALISSTLEDGAALLSSGYENSPVAAAAAGLFSLPALALAMFRAVSPYYYAMEENAGGSGSSGGNMFLYNDAMYLAEQLAALSAAWQRGGDEQQKQEPHKSVHGRVPTLVRLDGEVAKLQAFASRAYGREMALQRTVLRDLLGGDQNVLSVAGGVGGGGVGADNETGNGQDVDDCVDAAVARVRSMAAAWDGILARSAWCQAVAALVETVAAKLLVDVQEMASISQDEAYSLARLIARVTELDDLFAEARQDKEGDDGDGNDNDPENTPAIPMTAQYVPSWLRLQYLSEVLQSNLREVRFLWMESELSLYFSADEVVDLIRLSFEDNAKAREVAREIAQNPHPVEV